MQASEGAAVSDRGVDAALEYREFADARAAQLFRIAYLMCGDWHEAEDHSIESVARLLDATPSAVKSLNTRGLAQLRELLGSDQDLFQS
jgi:hypothetical protein